VKLLLIEPPEQVPPRPLLYPTVIPRGLLITAAVLRERGASVKVFDLRSLNVAPESVAERWEGQSPDAAGVSVHGVPSLKPARECIQVCHRVWLTARMVVGGFLAKAAGQFIRQYIPKFVDICGADSDVASAQCW